MSGDEVRDEYVVLRKADAEALNEEHAIFDDPFWRPVQDADVPSCTCGSIGLYAEIPPRFGPHHHAACPRHLRAAGLLREDEGLRGRIEALCDEADAPPEHTMRGVLTTDDIRDALASPDAAGTP